MKTLLALSGTTSRTSDFNVTAMAAHLGASVRLVELAEWASAPDVTSSVGVAIHADTVAALYKNHPDRTQLRERLLATGALFLHGVAAKTHDEPVKWLTGGIVASAVTVDGADYCDLPSAGAKFTREMAGSQFAIVKDRTTVLGVREASQQAGAVTFLATVGGAPTFVCAEQGGCRLFVTTVSEFPDPDLPVTKEEDVEAFYESLVPLVVFVRAACEPFCWHGSEGAARLIIDDPVLRRTYGCLDFDRLLDSLRRHRYGATVAYIPWNQSRTSRKAASFFGSTDESFLLCVHGCDHTNNEYGSTDEAYLLHKSRLALDRMQRHRARTGIAFDPVMVFPQGRFSTASLRALRSAGFLAAVNSTRVPVDADETPVRLWQLLQPAISSRHGFPVFCRHYVEPAFPFVFDLFLGRPAFAVEHHEFFKDGFPVMEALADRLNRCAPRLRWGSLSETIERVCWKRAASATVWDVRFYADRFILTNDADRRLTYRLAKDEPDPAAISGVSIDGRLASTEREAKQLACEVSLEPGATARVEVHRPSPPSRKVAAEGRLYAGRVLVRRALSEFRDEFLVKHPVMLASAKRMVRALKASSDSLPSPGPSALRHADSDQVTTRREFERTR